MKRIVFVLVALWLVMAYGLSHAAEVVLQWNSTPNTDGYKIYYRLEGEAGYREPEDAGNQTSYVMSFPVPESIGKWYFALTAYNQYGESGFSAEAGPADITGKELEPITPAPFVSGKIIFTLQDGQVTEVQFIPAE